MMIDEEQEWHYNARAAIPDHLDIFARSTPPPAATARC